MRLISVREVGFLLSDQMHDSLLEGIRSKSVRVCVVGLGYVGLPTSVVCGSSGFTVTGVDVKPEVVERVARGEDSMGEPGLRKLRA